MSETILLKRKRSFVSPLRYPGGKGILSSYLQEVIRVNGLTACRYVEPYGGGAGAALSLLVSGLVDKIVINDYDPAIYSFWKAVTTEPDKFIELISGIDVSIAEREKQRDIYLNSSKSEEDIFSLGFAAFYLNRTNRSGILRGGPIGGYAQTGKYKIDARFNKEDLIERIRLISLYADRISVTNVDGKEIISKFSNYNSTFIYADPPYFEKAESLYLNSFNLEDHKMLAKCISSINNAKWILTYDNVPQVSELYSNFRRKEFSIIYSAHRVMKAKEIMVFSDNLIIPKNVEFK